MVHFDGKAPWAVDMFESEAVFDEAKKEATGIADIALAPLLESSAMPEERVEELGSLLRSLLGPANERSLEPLLRYLDEYVMSTIVSVKVKKIH